MEPRRETCFLTHMMARSTWPGIAAMTAFVLTLSTESPSISAQEAKAGPLPPGVAACDVKALTNDHTREGLNIRTEPRADSAILGSLPVIENVNGEKIAADVHVIGVKNGWFLIEGAAYGDYDLPEKLPPVYAGRGWVSGKLLTTTLQTQSLKAAPDKSAADVVEFDWFDATAILDCKGDWLRIEAPLATKDRTLKPKLPSDGPPNSVRGWGWGRLSCTNQRTTCDFGGIEPPPPPILEVWRDEANTKCLVLTDEQNTDCKVEQFGELGVVYVTNLYYAMYHYADPKNHVLDYRRVVALEDTGGGHLHQLFATPGDPAVQYDKPRIIKLADRTLLWIPGHESGTGNLNQEELFVWRDYEWRKGDTASWLGDLAARLPSGRTVQKGVYPGLHDDGGRDSALAQRRRQRLPHRGARQDYSGMAGGPRRCPKRPSRARRRVRRAHALTAVGSPSAHFGLVNSRRRGYQETQPCAREWPVSPRPGRSNRCE